MLKAELIRGYIPKIIQFSFVILTKKKYLVPQFVKGGTGIIKHYFTGITNCKLHPCHIKPEMRREG